MISVVYIVMLSSFKTLFCPHRDFVVDENCILLASDASSSDSEDIDESDAESIAEFVPRKKIRKAIDLISDEE